MVLTTPKQVKEVDLNSLRKDAVVRVSGYFYSADPDPELE